MTRVEVSAGERDSWVTRWRDVEIPPAPRYATGELVCVGDVFSFDYFGIRTKTTLVKGIKAVVSVDGEVEFWVDPLHFPGLGLHPHDLTLVQSNRKASS